MHKLLCDGLTFTAGTACAYSCRYCYVESMVLKQKAIRDILQESGKSFNELVIRRNNPVQRLASALTRKQRKGDLLPAAEEMLSPELIEKWGLVGEWSLANRVPKFHGPEWVGKVIFGSPMVDVAATKELAQETEELCAALLLLTPLHIRLLSKSPLLASVAERLHKRFPDSENGAKARMIFGLSIGTFDEKAAAGIEPHTPSPTKRLEGLHKLQDQGFRTFGMLCPILPQADGEAYKRFAEQAMAAIRAERCEEVWAEALNCRFTAERKPEAANNRNSFEATLQGLEAAGCMEEAKRFKHVAEDGAAWEAYARALFEALAAAAPAQTIPRLVVGEKIHSRIPNKLWWLQYPRNFDSIATYWRAQQPAGAVLLGASMTNYSKTVDKLLDVVAGVYKKPLSGRLKKLMDEIYGAEENAPQDEKSQMSMAQ